MNFIFVYHKRRINRSLNNAVPSIECALKPTLWSNHPSKEEFYRLAVRSRPEVIILLRVGGVGDLKTGFGLND
jgi:hypothetical protein